MRVRVWTVYAHNLLLWKQFAYFKLDFLLLSALLLGIDKNEQTPLSITN